MKKQVFAVLILIMCLAISCSEILFETDISDSYVNVLAPTQNSNVPSGTVTFSWEAVQYADDYNIQIATPNFELAKQIVADSNVTGTNFKWQLLPNNYEWRIRAQNSAFETIYFYNSLAVIESEDFANSEVILLSPPSNFTTNEVTQTLTWNKVEGATEYRIQVLNPDTSGTIEHEEITNNTSLTYDFNEGQYSWQVRAQNTTQNTLYYSRSILIDITNPGEVSLQSPENESVEAAGKVSFSWLRNDIDGSKEFDSIYLYNNKELTNLVWKERSDEKEIEKELTEGNYYWFIQPFDEAGNKGVTSAVFELEVN